MYCTCSVCGIDFFHGGYNYKSFCSRECLRKAQLQSQVVYRARARAKRDLRKQFWQQVFLARELQFAPDVLKPDAARVGL
jgi:hypothetical protein